MEFLSLNITKLVSINCGFLFLTRTDGLTAGITGCCIIDSRKVWAPSSRLSFAVRQRMELLTQCLVFVGFYGIKNVLYKCLKFSREWVYCLWKGAMVVLSVFC